MCAHVLQDFLTRELVATKKLSASIMHAIKVWQH
jgi:hypothetical protein